MDIIDIATLRLANQQLVNTKFKTPREIVSWMGAMQAQDFSMAKWGIGVRLPGTTDKQIEEAVNNGDIIRTHILRPTWHFVSRDDIHWILQLSAPRVRLAARSVDRELGLTDDVLIKAHSIICKSLEKEPNQTRPELAKALEEARIVLSSRRMSHIMFHAELNGLICSGTLREKVQTYDLLERKVPKTEVNNLNETLYRLAYKYFQSHGPATQQDFIWWSGLTGTEARTALALIKPNFVFQTIGNQTYIFHQTSLDYKHKEDMVHFLPAFDELLVSYRDRKEALSVEHHKKVITKNGIFRPAVFHNGRVIGLWKRTVGKDGMVIDTDYFSSPERSLQNLIKKASADYEIFMK
ncbi:winged helix DNA-binding domain-containing protein [Prevotella sp. 10(H)]|uniref:winged helix DNA-binding domain-containing protein n=1 Tax=Prevotella sp. 10(H) TaxID=1158294 RepID=UPI0004A766ED|nr:winged helix DNA-binding domain-containing protein [Prevotella sp. 10(H)]